MATNTYADAPSERMAMDDARVARVQRCTGAAHVAILPTPGMGHLIPLLELAAKLHLLHGFTSTVLLDHSHRDDPILLSLPPSVSTILLPPPLLDHLPASSKIETRIILSVSLNLPAIRASLLRLSQEFSLRALVADLFGGDALRVARELGVASYIFYPPNATVLSLFLHLPVLDEATTCEYRDLPDLLHLPGCVPLHGRDLLDPVQDRGDEAYRLLVLNCKKYYEADGILVNSFDGIEPGPCQALRGHVSGRPPVYPIGPLTRNGGPTGVQNDPTGCLQWLDRQPVGSVLYVSFGSGGVLSYEQMTELAAGLEMSGQRFLWVVRPPTEGPADGDFFGIRDRGDPLGFLPGGFLERIQHVGLVVPNWAPQPQVLGHEATGGFLTHCGWNSTLESLVNGVPMIVWPLYAEQRTNAVILVEEAKVAIRPAAGVGCGVVGREEVSRVVKALMEGEEGKKVRRRVKAVANEARAALAEGGTSRAALAEVARRWKNRAG